MQVIYYDKNGGTIEKPIQGFEYRVMAKRLTGEHIDRYFVASDSSKIMDPRKLTDRQIKTYYGKLIEVGFEVFEKYLQYLQNKDTRTPFNSIERMIR